MPSDFFTNESFFSLAGATAIVFVVCNTLQRAFGFNPKWLALVISEAVAILGLTASQRQHVPSDYIVAMLNGCLIFSAAGGGTAFIASTAAKGAPRGVVSRPRADRRALFTPWF